LQCFVSKMHCSVLAYPARLSAFCNPFILPDLPNKLN
jgi:hypothetical protein